MPVSLVISSKFKNSVISVGTSATKLPSVPLIGRAMVVIQNLSNNQVFLGDSTVTTTGVTRSLVLPGKFAILEFKLKSEIDLFGIADLASDVVVFEGA